MSRVATAFGVAGLCLASLAAGPSIAFSGAATVLFVGGTGGSVGALLDTSVFWTQDSLLGGQYKNDYLQIVDYPNSLWPVTGLWDLTFGKSVAAGAVNVESAIRSAAGPVFVVGVSQGAIVAQTAMAAVNNDASISSDVTFVMIASPNNGLFQEHYGDRLPVFDYSPEPQIETRFNTVVVLNEYDGWADPISNPLNLWTVANAFMAMIYVHPFAQNSDLSSVPSENIFVESNSQGGTTSRYLVPTKQLPLTMPLRIAGLPEDLVDMIDGALRPIIDAGYERKIPELQAREDAKERTDLSARPMEDRVHRAEGNGHPTSPRSAEGLSGDGETQRRAVANRRPTA